MSELEEMTLDYVLEFGVTIETAREMAADVALRGMTPEESIEAQYDAFGVHIYE